MIKIPCPIEGLLLYEAKNLVIKEAIFSKAIAKIDFSRGWILQRALFKTMYLSQIVEH